LGGGGGGGGIITIVGTTRPPEQSTVDLEGKPGRDFGAGGGGGGALQFVGRPATKEDTDAGLRISSMFIANSALIHGTLNVLGGAWTYIQIPTVPAQLSVLVVVVVEFGKLAPESLIRLRLIAVDQFDNVGGEGFVDVAVPASRDLVRRASACKSFMFGATQFGLWSIRASSDTQELARYDVEIRCIEA
jgi:hypothetical protein